MQPDKFALMQNYSNPFIATTRIGYSIPYFANVKIEVFDLQGKIITTLINAKQMPAGIYFYRLQSGAQTATRKMIILQ